MALRVLSQGYLTVARKVPIVSGLLVTEPVRDKAPNCGISNVCMARNAYHEWLAVKPTESCMVTTSFTTVEQPYIL